jgi:hypothetical protein
MGVLVSIRFAPSPNLSLLRLTCPLTQTNEFDATLLPSLSNSAAEHPPGPTLTVRMERSNKGDPARTPKFQRPARLQEMGVLVHAVVLRCSCRETNEDTQVAKASAIARKWVSLFMPCLFMPWSSDRARLLLASAPRVRTGRCFLACIPHSPGLGVLRDARGSEDQECEGY